MHICTRSGPTAQSPAGSTVAIQAHTPDCSKHRCRSTVYDELFVLVNGPVNDSVRRFSLSATHGHPQPVARHHAATTHPQRGHTCENFMQVLEDGYDSFDITWHSRRSVTTAGTAPVAVGTHTSCTHDHKIDWGLRCGFIWPHDVADADSPGNHASALHADYAQLVDSHAALVRCRAV